MGKVKHRNKKTYIVLFILVMCALLVGGIALLGVWCGESWQLLKCDILSGFRDAGSYKNFLLLFLLCYVVAGIYLWEAMVGKVRLQWEIRLFKKQYHCTSGRILNSHPVCTAFVAFAVMGVGLYLGYGDYCRAKVTDTWRMTKTIGHSFGLIGKDTYTGSLEAFQHNYELGQRTFEVDLAVTADGKLVLKHDWDFPAQEGISGENIPTEATFLEAPIYGKYTPLSFEDLCRIMQEYPDIWIVTDSKSEEPKQVKREFELLVETASNAGCEEILDRLVIQVYSERMYECLRENFEFDSYIYTLYQKWYGTTEEMLEISRYCANNGIGIVAFQDSFYSEEMQEIADRYGLEIYLHTINDVEQTKQCLQMGAGGVYTDVIVPDELEED